MKQTISILCLAFGLALAAGPAFAQSSDADAIRQSYRYEKSGKYQQALKVMAGMSDVQSSYFLVLRRGWLLYLTGQYEDSARAYATSATKNPKAIEPLLGQMLPVMALRRWKDAAAIGYRVLKRAPNNYLANSRIAWCDYNLGRFAEARARYQAVLALFPGDFEMRSGYAWSLLKLGQKEAARQHFQLALAIAPDYTSAQTGLSLAK